MQYTTIQIFSVKLNNSIDIPIIYRKKGRIEKRKDNFLTVNI